MRQSLARIGVKPEAEAIVARAEVRHNGSSDVHHTSVAPVKDFFVERDGRRYAGSHLIIDLWQAENLDDLGAVERALRRSVEAAGATLLHLHLHRFTPNGGISGVAVLAESHISIHTWPERGYAALDAFMCGNAEPRRVLPVLEDAFRPGRIEVNEWMRGAF
jgi:S-adenosylmethionine decarboxylase